jgi:hypothetical protein
MNTSTLISATTEAANSAAFHVKNGYPVTLIMYASSGLVGGEYANLQVSHDKGVSWQDVYQDSDQIRLSSINNLIQITIPGLFRIAKEATTNATLLALTSEVASKYTIED